MKTRIRSLFQNPWVLPTVAAIVTITTVGLLAVAIGTIRTQSLYDRVLRRIELLDRRNDYGEEYQDELENAARYARSVEDWKRILRLAWRRPQPERWRTTYELARTAVSSTRGNSELRLIGGYAAIRLGDNAGADEMVQTIANADDTTQYLRLLARIEPGSPEQSRTAIIDLDQTGPPMPLVQVVAEALYNPDADSLWNAWETTGITSFALNSALHAAVSNDRDRVARAVEFLRRATGSEETGVYLAIWLQDIDWFFNQVRRLSPQNAVAPEVLLLQADAHALQRQWDEAHRIYRELQETHPRISALPFINDAILTRRFDDAESPFEILRRGERFHENDRSLQLTLATFDIQSNDHEGALRRLDRMLELLPTDHTAWLLRRILLARTESDTGVSAERLESDLWLYLNRYPDAVIVASFLARILRIRGDTAGLEELRRRYPPNSAPWAAIIHLIEATETNRMLRAEEMLSLQFPDEGRDFEWIGYYNSALFALQYLPLAEAARAISRYRTWWERDAFLPDRIYDRAGTELLLLEAELARLREDTATALRHIDRAIAITPSRESLYSYRTLIAPRD